MFCTGRDCAPWTLVAVPGWCLPQLILVNKLGPTLATGLPVQRGGNLDGVQESRGVARDNAPRAGVRGVNLLWSKNRRRPKKGLRHNTRGYLVQWSYGFTSKYDFTPYGVTPKWCHSRRAAPRPLSDDTAEVFYCSCLVSTPRDKPIRGKKPVVGFLNF